MHERLIKQWVSNRNSQWNQTEGKQRRIGKKQYQVYNREIKKCLMNNKKYNVMLNILKIRQCNYDQCDRRDWKRYRICKRCKSVFYCCRLHQKLDWNKGDHKLYCVEREKRDYKIFSKRFVLNIDDKTKQTALRLLA